MFRTRLAALILAGSLSFSSGCAGLSNLFGCPGQSCCGGPPPCYGGGAPCYGGGSPCCGETAGFFSPPGDVGPGPVLMPQGGLPGDPGAVHITPTPTPTRLQQVPQVPQSQPVPAMPSGLLR
jgi:hypothetical protein